MNGGTLADGIGAPDNKGTFDAIGTDPVVIRVLIADDHALVREGLGHILRKARCFEIAGEAADAESTLAMVNQAFAQVLLLDLSMPGGNGLDLIPKIRAMRPALKILVLTMHAERQYALRAFKAGANGYLTKESASTELVNAVSRVAGGHPYVSMAMAENMAVALTRGANDADGPPPQDTLSDRELDVYRRFVAGQSINEIAAALHVSPKTVSTYKARILEKMAMTTDAALIRYAVKHGLFDDLGD
ncbi:response regulator [Robbsia andropogonis]|uniref:response regulator n=1 Tax=Robbsia andropogonis TaxID=28092 RepID=UPI0004652FF8|nr:response regulator transcription factor [Robbsia andropogonis]